MSIKYPNPTETLTQNQLESPESLTFQHLEYS